jgi:xanthine/uracil/vitamin C permease (AzgA family)
MSGLTFLVSMLLLKFSHTVPTFVAAYVMYALSQVSMTYFNHVKCSNLLQSITPAPQVTTESIGEDSC